MIEIIAGSLLGAATFRLRGDVFISKLLGVKNATTEGRLVWAIPMAGLAALAAGDWRLLALAPALFLGSIFGWYSAMDLARGEGNYWRDFAVLALRGLVWTLFCGPVLWWFEYPWWFAFAGLLCPLAYEIGWRIEDKTRSQGAPYETVFGAMLGGTLLASVL